MLSGAERCTLGETSIAGFAADRYIRYAADAFASMNVRASLLVLAVLGCAAVDPPRDLLEEARRTCAESDELVSVTVYDVADPRFSWRTFSKECPKGYRRIWVDGESADLDGLFDDSFCEKDSVTLECE